jgi:hypothetical protein
MNVIKAPQPIVQGKSMIFLAGSIEMGKAVQWQELVTAAFKSKDVTILNPRRDDWDSTWVQSKDNKQFRQQVEWELAAMEAADIIAMYFDPKTQSPITLLELGLYAVEGSKLIVCCPEGFWRKGNVDIVCERYRVPQAKDLEDLIEMVWRIV